MLRACKTCHFLSEDVTVSGCPNAECPGATAKNWSGLLSIMEPEKSALAEAMNITRPGNYALKVR